MRQEDAIREIRAQLKAVREALSGGTTRSSSMTKNELELAYLRALNEWMTEEYNTRLMVMQQNLSGYSDQVKKEEAAHKKYVSASRTPLVRVDTGLP